MKSISGSKSKYLADLKKRTKESRAYTAYQVLGLEIAEILGDQNHKSLYIKLAKDGDPHTLLRLAKSVAEKKHVKSKGAYFMKVLKETRNQKSS
jgi:hypothetical protein